MRGRFIPALMIDDVTAITAQEVGICKALLLDLDNTLTIYNGMDVSPEVEVWLGEMKHAGLQVCIVSNNHEGRIRPVAEYLGVPFIEKAQKPDKKGFLRAAEQLGLPPEQCCVVGDQLMTDISGGNAAGMRTILVRPIDPTREYGGTYINRAIEWIVMKLMNLRWPHPRRKKQTQKE